jgi:hypothetical protein
MKLLIISENPSSNPFQEACSDFPIATYDLVTLKIFSKAGQVLNVPTLEKSNQ